MEKEFLYVGHYYSIDRRYILKIGTTNNLERRRKEHTRNYRKTPHYPMSEVDEFVYDWYIELSKYNTLRYEDKNRKNWQEENIGEFIRNDRFVCGNCPPEFVVVSIRNDYVIEL